MLTPSQAVPANRGYRLRAYIIYYTGTAKAVLKEGEFVPATITLTEKN